MLFSFLKKIIFNILIITALCACGGQGRFLSENEKQSWGEARDSWNNKDGGVVDVSVPASISDAPRKTSSSRKPPKEEKPVAKKTEEKNFTAQEKTQADNSAEEETQANLAEEKSAEENPVAKNEIEDTAENENVRKVAATEDNNAAIADVAGNKPDTITDAAGKSDITTADDTTKVAAANEVSDSSKNSADKKIVNTTTATMIAGFFTQKMWDELFPNRYGVAASGKNSTKEVGEVDFYSFAAFAEACKRFPLFLHEGSDDNRIRELAAFLAHIAQETGGLRYLEQLTVDKSYAVDNREYPPVEEKTYQGRGPIQLSYNYNYGQFSRFYYEDKNVLLEKPEILAEDAVVSFSSALWFWMTMQPPKPSCHDVMSGVWEPIDIDKESNRLPGFGLTLNIINAPQCGKPALPHTKNRFEQYEKFCRYFGVNKGKNCDCEKQVPYGWRPKNI